MNSDSHERSDEEENDSSNSSGEKSGNNSNDDIIPSVDDYFNIEFLIEHENHSKVHVGKVLKIVGDEIILTFLHRKSSWFVFSPVEDMNTVNISALCRRMFVCSSKRDSPIDKILLNACV